MTNKSYLQECFNNISDLVQATTLDFVKTEFEMALTFCNIAAEAAVGSERRARNIKNARKAYRGAINAMRRISPGPSDRAHLKRLDIGVRHAVEDLGVHL